MSSNTNIGNTPVNQGYVQLIHTGETGGIDGTLRTLYDGDGTASDLQIASNKVKVSTELYIGSKTATEFIQDIVGDMFTTGSYTNITTTYDDTNGNIDLSASGEVTLTGTQTLTNKTLASPTFTGTANGANLTLTGDLTVSGDTIFTNSNTVLIGDAILTLNADETGSPTANAGFEVERGTSANKTFIWNETDDKWTIGSETFVASTVEANLTGNVTGNVTGSASLNLLKSSNLSDLANVATARSNLGVDPAGTDNSTDVTLVTTSHDYLSLAGQAITLGTIDISDDTNLVGGTGITLTGDTLSTTDSEIVHDNLNGFVENEHKDHSGISITTAASSGLSGGGDITTTRSLSVDVNNLDVQVPALELADKIAIYDNSATETNVATLTQLKAIVNTDTNTNQLTTFDVSGDSGTDQTISHNNTLTISGGNGISTSTSATDILSVALGGFSTLIAQSSPAEQDLLVIEEAIGGAIKKVQIGALSSGITIDGTTANGILTYGGVDNIDTEANLTFDGTDLQVGSANADTIIKVAGNRAMFGYDNGNFAIVQGGNTKGIKFNTNTDTFAGSPKMTITTDGLVGIGTVSPAYKLDVNGGIRNYANGSAVFRTESTAAGYGAYNKLITTTNTYDLYALNGDFKIDENGVATRLTIKDTTGNVGIGMSSNINERLNVYHSSSADVLGIVGVGTTGSTNFANINFRNLYSSATGDSAIIGCDTGSTTDKGELVFSTSGGSMNATERMRITSGGNVGIGDTNPPNKLSVKGSSTDLLYLEGDGITSNSIIQSDTGGSVRTRSAGGTWQLYTGGSANSSSASGADFAMEVDSSQRVGIGTTSPSVKLDVAGDIALKNNATYLYFKDASGTSFRGMGINSGNNFYLGPIDPFAGGFMLYGASANTSGHVWYSGNAEAMRIDSSQRVGIGTNSPATKLHIQNGSTSYTWSPYAGTTAIFEGTSSNHSIVSIVGSTTGQSSIWFGDTDHQSIGRVRYEHANNQMEFWTNGIERVAIDSSGNVGIGETSPEAKLHIKNASAGTFTASNSQLLIENNTTCRLTLLSPATNGCKIEFGDINDQDVGMINYDHSNNYMQFFTNAGERARILSTGAFHVTNDVVAFSSTPSDQKLKTNVKDIEYGLDTIMKLKPKHYDWKKDNRKDIGFIAQEVEEVIPEIVKDNEWFDDKIKTMDYEKLTAVLIKAVQEQQEQINKLEEKLNG